MYYSSFGALSLIITLIINHNVIFHGGQKNIVGNRYRRFLLSVMVYYLSDVLWGVFYEYKLIKLTYADTVIYFLAMVLSVLLWTSFVVDYLGGRGFFGGAVKAVGWTILLFVVTALVINFFVPFVFYMDAKGVYRPGNARYVALVAQIALFLSAAVYTLVFAFKSKGQKRRQHLTICLSGVVMTVFIILQSVFPFAPFYGIGCLLATCTVHAFVTEDERKEMGKMLGKVTEKAYTDPLTGVKSATAYTEAKEKLEGRIAEGALGGFAVVVFDLNGLKTVNDTEGHDYGDRYLKDACSMICAAFKHSPVYRIGGDEFVAFLEGDDYADRKELIGSFDSRVENNIRNGGGIVIASGMSEYRPGEDLDYKAIFDRADQKMYERKEKLKTE